jgi:hypothetical protein
MDKVIFLKKEYLDGMELEHAIIDRGNGEYTSMLKSTYDAMQAEQSTPIAPTDNYLTPPAIMESTQPDEADLTEGNN